MIGYIRGKLHSYTEQTCILATSGGVGYEIYITQGTLEALRHHEGESELYIASIVREDAFLLFGFLSQEMKQMFLILTSISKVGAKTALSILEIFSVQDLYSIVTQRDVNRLSTVSGIGKKTAQHIILELQYKLEHTHSFVRSIEKKEDSASSPLYLEAKEALLALGYNEAAIHTAILEITKEEPSIEIASLLKRALGALSL